MLAQLVSLLTVTTIALASFGLGRPIIRALGIAERDRLATGVWSIALGLVLAGLLLATLGLLGLLYAPAIGVLTLAACFWAIGELGRSHIRRYEQEFLPDDQSEQLDEAPSAPWSPPAAWLLRGMLILAGLACLGSLLCALVPPSTAATLDYHLELPKAFLAEHALFNMPHEARSTGPLLAEMWFLWALALDGPVAATLVHWGLGILLGLATVLLATPIVGRPWAWMAGCVVLLVPGISGQMAAAQNDVAVALMATLALGAWWQVVVGDESRRWLLPAGMAAGGALAVKHTAILFVCAASVASLWILIRQAPRRRALIEGAVVVSLLSLMVAGPWYVRAAYHRGDPVYPFFAQMRQIDVSTGETATGETAFAAQSDRPLGRSLPQLAAAPWHVTMHPERFGGREYQLGALLLAAVPGMILTRRLRGLGILLGMAAAYGTLWYLLRQDLRLLFPVVPLLAVAVAWVWIEMRRFPSGARVLAGTVQAVALVACAVVPLADCRGQLAVAVGLESRYEYLSRVEPTYRGAAMVNELSNPDTHVLSQDSRTFYFDHAVTSEDVYRRSSPDYDHIRSAAALSQRLRRDGFTHLLLAKDVDSPTNKRGTERRGTERRGTVLNRLVDAEFLHGEQSLREWTPYEFDAGHGPVRQYRLIMLY